MGAIFRLEHANVMAYLTSRSFAAPRVRQQDLSEFLDVFIYNPEQYLIPERGYEPWPEHVAEIARRARTRLDETRGNSNDPSERQFGEQRVVNGRVVEDLLSELRSEFSYYPLYALAVGEGDELREKAESLARLPFYGNLLVLIPEQSQDERNFNVIDPVPSFSVGLHAASEWPGFVFWTLNGASCFCAMNGVDDLISLLRREINEGDWRRRHHRPWPEFGYPGTFDAILKKWEAGRGRQSRRLLHLSDLHFGTEYATENLPFLNGELRDVVKDVDRVVITGDLFDTPNKRFATEFTTFRDSITYLSGGTEPIAITGNHDQRMKGIWGNDYEQVARIGPSRVEVDDKCEMIFICFNSSEGGLMAQGKISDSQFRSIGAEYRNLLAARSELKSYLPIVLVHHHPFSFKAEPEGWLERMMNRIGFSLEPTLVLKSPEKLYEWCVDWDIKTILHGHKHKARYVERSVNHAGREMLLTAIGCGSSLGAEDSPVSYNLLEWEPTKQKWVASFHESTIGGAFRELAVSVSS